uniref:Prefoldin subunit 5 n=1 Tax=Accipiter nisus TaxID=211598 RepID=A0A8B9S140_9AVES
MAQTVNVGELPLPQLELLKGQLDQEVEFLSSSIAQLKVVQTKYVEAKDCLNVLNKSNEGKDLLVPLTSSMYVPGKLSDVERVLIDVGTGYYVEKTADDARDFFKRKIDFLTKQMEKIQPALQEKHAMKQGAGPFPGVSPLMPQQLRPVAEALPALIADKGALTATPVPSPHTLPLFLLTVAPRRRRGTGAGLPSSFLAFGG